MTATRKLAESFYKEAILLFPNHCVPRPEEEGAEDAGEAEDEDDAAEEESDDLAEENEDDSFAL